jgi:hypothetical protein
LKFLKPSYLKPSRPGEWLDAMARYKEHFESIRSRLPQDAIAFHGISLHDEVIKEVVWWEEARWLRLRVPPLDLIFLDVDSVTFPQDFDDAVWLYDEMLTWGTDGFELNVLTDAGEMQIRAGALRVWDSRRNVWKIGPEPPAPEVRPDRKRHHGKQI